MKTKSILVLIAFMFAFVIVSPSLVAAKGAAKDPAAPDAARIVGTEVNGSLSAVQGKQVTIKLPDGTLKTATVKDVGTLKVGDPVELKGDLIKFDVPKPVPAPAPAAK